MNEFTPEELTLMLGPSGQDGMERQLAQAAALRRQKDPARSRVVGGIGAGAGLFSMLTGMGPGLQNTATNTANGLYDLFTPVEF